MSAVTLVLLGATGDLVARYLLPALARLWGTGRLPEDVAVLGVSRDDLDDAGFRDRAGAALAEHAPELTESDRRALLERAWHTRADVTSGPELTTVLERVQGAPVVYLALPNTLFGAVITALGEAGLGDRARYPGGRVVVEKPFGTGLDDACALNAQLARLLPEDAVFRVDHFLAKQTVLNLLGLRFANRVFEGVWNGEHVERVDIVFDETLGLEGRAGYYDGAGALRDMLQNHLLQLLALVAMDPPATLGERDLRDRKAAVLRAVRTPDRAAVTADTVRGRYTAGRVGDRELPDYVSEAGVDPDRGTETFAQARLYVDNWRWAGVPFVLRSGKALGRDRREIVVRFRPVPHLPFGDQHVEPDVLRLELGPDRISLGVNLNGAGDPFDVERAELTTDLADTELSPYSQLLAAVLAGDPRLSIRGDEAQECWRIVEPILAAWADGAVPLHDYPAGSDGPSPDGADRVTANPLP